MLIPPARARSILQKAIEKARFDERPTCVRISASPVYEIECTRFGGVHAREQTIQRAILTAVQLRRPRGEPDIYREIAEWIARQMNLSDSGDRLVLGAYGMQVEPECITIQAGFLDTAE